MQFLIYILTYPLLRLISILPFPVFYMVSDGVYFLLYRVIGYRKKVVRQNLQLSFPEKSLEEIISIESKFYKHFCDLFLEMIKSLDISEKEIKKRFRFTNIELLKQYEQQQRSIILTTGHYASYEWLMSMGYYVSLEGFAIYAPLSNKYFDRLVQRIRGKHHGNLLSRYKAMPFIESRLSTGHTDIYGFANDQSPQLHKAHYWRTFMGVEVPVFTNAERIAKKYNLPVLHVAVKKLKRGYYEGTFIVLAENPQELPDYQITDRFTETLERQIREAPEFYLWTHNRFKHRRKQEVTV